VRSDIRVCTRAEHDRPVYTLRTACPDCGEPTENSAPAPFDPADPYGEYRRRARARGERRVSDADAETAGDAATDTDASTDDAATDADALGGG
jgi:H/ACA ribonucleoprotein complex subunit 3